MTPLRDRARPRMRARVAIIVGAVTAVLIVGLVATRFTPSPEPMTEEDKAAIAAIAETERAAVETVATKVAGWNKSKDASVVAFSVKVSEAVAKLETAIESGDWQALKSHLSPSVAAAMDAQGATRAVRAVGDIALTWDPLVVPDMEMPTHAPYVTWDEWEPGGQPYAEYAASYEPIFTGTDGMPSSADAFAPEPWSPPDRIDAKGVVLTGGQAFGLPIHTEAGVFGLALQDLLSVPGLIDEDSPILGNSSAPMTKKAAAARAYLAARITAWNRAKDTALIAYNADIQSQIDPEKIATIETAFETGDSDALMRFLEPDFAEDLSKVDWYKRLQELVGDELRDPGIKLVYEPLEVEDLQLPQGDPPPTIEDWCDSQDCAIYPYNEYVKEYEPKFDADGAAVGVTAERYPIPKRWVPPDTPATVNLVNPKGWLELRIPVQLSMLR